MVKVISRRRLSDKDLEEDEDDEDGGTEESYELSPHAVPVNKGRKQEVTVRCPGHVLVLRTNKFVWPFSWLNVRIRINSGGYRLEESVQNGYFTPTDYFLDDLDDVNLIHTFLVSTKFDSDSSDKEKGQTQEQDAFYD